MRGRQNRNNTMTAHRVLIYLCSIPLPKPVTIPHSNLRLRPTSFYLECHSMTLDPQCKRATLVALKIKR